MSPSYCFLRSSWNIIDFLFSKVASFKSTKFTSRSQWLYHEQNYTLYLPVALMFGLNNILFEFKNMSSTYIYTYRVYEDLNESLWLI